MHIGDLLPGDIIEVNTPLRLELCDGCTNEATVNYVNYHTVTGIPMLSIRWNDTGVDEDITHTEFVRLIKRPRR